MTLAIMQPYFMPYIGYFQLLNCVDKFVIYDDVNYINRGWINRNNVLMNGKANMITIPLVDASQNRKIADIYISDDAKWQGKLVKTMEHCYKNAPYFKEVTAILANVLDSNAKKITDINYRALKAVAAYLNMDTEIVQSSACYDNVHLKGQERILDICLKESATHYINPIGGLELYDRDYFEANRIKLSFIKTKEVVYEQYKNDFVPWLSMIDVLMFNSPDKIHELLNCYELV